MEVTQAGPIQTSLFFDAHGYRVLGDRTVKLSASTSASCPHPAIPSAPPGYAGDPTFPAICALTYGVNPSDYSAEWSFEVDPWLYRMGVGLRFRWTGE